MKYPVPKIVHAPGSNQIFFTLFRTSALEKTGLYMMPFYMGFDDSEFGFRTSGLKQVFLKEVIWAYSEKSPVCGMMNAIHKKKFQDPTYIYSTSLGCRLMPQALLQNGSVHFMRASVPFQYQLALFKARAPLEIGELQQKVADGRFCKTMYSFREPLLLRQPAKKAGKSQAKGGIASLFSSIASSGGAVSADSSVFEPFAYDRFVYSELPGGGAAYECSWQSRLRMGDKIFCLASAVLASIALLANAHISRALGRPYLGAGYGLAALMRHEKEREEALGKAKPK